MLISGGKQKTEGTSFRVVIGHGAWVFPGLRKVRFLGLDLHTVAIEESCRSNEGILLNLKAVAAFKVQSDPSAINAAAQRFLGEQKRGQMEEMTVKIFAGHLRSIVGAMKLLDIHQNRDALAAAVIEHSQMEMSRLGLTVDSLQIEHLDDNNAGYLDNLARPHLAEAKKDADIAQARAEQEAAQAVQEAARARADQERQTAIKVAEIKAETDKANAIATQAGPLAQAKAQQEVIATQTETAQRNAVLREQQLVTEVQRPAEAAARQLTIQAEAQAAAAEAQARQMRVTSQAQADSNLFVAKGAAEAKVATAEAEARVVTLAGNAQAEVRVATAEADAKAVTLAGTAEASKVREVGLAEAQAAAANAEAMASNDRAQLELARIQIAPQVAAAIAGGLQGADLTILNGAEGLGSVVASLVQQGKALVEMFSTPAAPAAAAPVAKSVSNGFRELENATS
ncbi:SPFH domain-containing protein [Mycolicibacterium sphagni]|uniref:SPFH domain-containing protein n=1 Tax=Mycolicibacterium sphagni TaxID=1786 RepID=UPI0021F2B30F|nr:flotillin family protein [Mycolicibacterium sphagni]MCV7174787.1 flotillin [Mycolicibacterium sphagni]